MYDVGWMGDPKDIQITVLPEGAKPAQKDVETENTRAARTRE